MKLQDQETATTKRIEILDVYRGFAIFGIFAVNIVIMNSTFLNQDEFALQWTYSIDTITQKVLQLFFYTKFFPIFSLLFGLGISMQAIKLAEKGKMSTTFFVRRMFFLFLFGVLHISLLWSGDVLNMYAFLGLLTVFFIKKSNRLILGLSLLFLLFPFYDLVFEQIFYTVGFNPSQFLKDHSGETVSKIIKSGSYLEGMQLRFSEYGANFPMLVGFLAPIALSMFLLGLYLGKNKIYESLESFIIKIKKPALIIVVISNVYRILFLYVFVKLNVYKIEIVRQLFIKFMVISDVIMGLFYLWIIGWLWYKTKFRKILSPLKYAGKMALTNYLMQSFIGLLLFSSVGFSLYETMSPSLAFLTAILVFVFQIIISKIWLSYFKFGPLEWLWRCLTYRKLFKLKKDIN
ncbi:DUF418 domain-containing protein [uncultured Tenacibaculum sp.]|uniref:DUF418 domain-containing protein n=1 Tax=uncultured Tenacibaculum sp. TaxID=174713 RepID=UPI00263863D9|nr:DUF418 domain-containing protein [uncultured Tenacibaculum sp.]